MSTHKISSRVRKARKKLNSGYANLSRFNFKMLSHQPVRPNRYISTTPLSKRQQRKYSLRNQFTQAVKEYQKAVAERQALYDVAKVGTTEQALITRYQKLNYEKLFKEGTYRIEGNTKDGFKRVKYKGEQAIKLQLESLRNSSSSERRKDNFIRQYIKQMGLQGYSYGEREHVRRLLKDFTADELNIALTKGTIPDMYLVYVMDGSETSYQDLIQKIKNSKITITPEQRRQQQQLTKAYIEILNTKWRDIL